jgi:biofilm PGA synthesis protein PgaD
VPPWWRVRDGIATALMWLLYALMINAAIVGVMDLLRGEVTSLEGLRVIAVMPTLQDYGIVIAFNASLLIGWAIYNYIRFRGSDRRRGTRAVAPEVVARHFGADDALAARMSRARIGVLHLDPEGRILRFESDAPDPARVEAPVAAQ